MNRIASAIEQLSPNYFAMVMATGIVSTACHLTGHTVIAFPLLWLNVSFYLILWLLTMCRIACYWGRLFADLCDHQKGMQFLTTVAGTCVLGAQFIVLQENYRLGLALLVFGASLWIVLIYAILSSLTVRAEKPQFGDAINGSWLLATVSTQSVSVLIGRLVPALSEYQEVAVFLSLCMFMVAAMFYIMVITLIFYRLLFVALDPAQFTPAYWINMGAVAITTLAGATLVGVSRNFAFLETLKPFIAGLTVFFWAIATWWIPFLLAMEVWRRFVGGIKLAYTPLYWSVVFPLGMYTTCTVYLGKALDLDFVLEIPERFIYVAVVAWFLTFLGLLKTLAKGFFASIPGPQRNTGGGPAM